jgi:lipopolysaccharide/colanic/teichoic acid biosynthesis glycosyltransferase
MLPRTFGLLMSAHSIGESHLVDMADVVHVLATTEQPTVVRDHIGRAAILEGVFRPASYAVDGVSNASPWVVSAARRCFDSAVAAIALVVLLPAILLVMLLVRMSSPGPVFFRQRRAGRNREEFTLYKFRSMHAENCPGPEITVSGDPRITPVGSFLRRYKLDELPQFWNVLKGNMSLVGPRPKLPHHEGLDLPYRPGITGMATLAFRNEEKLLSTIPHDQLNAFYDICIKPKKARLDLEYMRHATFRSDLKLLWRTAASCLLGSDEESCEETKELTRFAAAWFGSHPTTATSLLVGNVYPLEPNFYGELPAMQGRAARQTPPS